MGYFVELWLYLIEGLLHLKLSHIVSNPDKLSKNVSIVLLEEDASRNALTKAERMK